MKQELIIEKIGQKIATVQEKRMDRSTDLAEEEHHKDCKYKCCGSHNDFMDFKKCPDCGMTEEIQDQHNDDWWSCVDYVEGDDEQCNLYCQIESILEDFLETLEKNHV